ncbi:hypothetical protein ACIBI8_37140 [Streptomyces sp. NPDC050529]|uniref:hypothetical protein n=1 Tax=Streptomyces sp. NPDC050529 TaxID=3365624 RepID=UPI0037A49877
MSAASGNEPHYTKIGEWVSECGAHGMETAAYEHLAKRLNHKSGSRIVDPSRARLASDLGLKKPDDVDPYLRALSALGAIVIHAKKGLRTQYELPLWPPDGWDGPTNTHMADKWQKDDPKGYAAWRAGQRAKVAAAEAPYAEKRRARVAKSVARKKAPARPDLPVTTGRSEEGDVPVATGTHLPVVTGTHLPVATGTNQDDPNDQTNMGDGRRPPTGSRGDAEGGCAASGKTDSPLQKPKPAELRAVIEGIPAPLVQLLERDWPRGLPAAVTDAISGVLTGEQRTVGQAVERMTRRWTVFGYEDALLSEEGAGIRTAAGVLDELLSPTKCWGNNANCEDGVDLFTGAVCPRCDEQRQGRQAEAARQGEPVVEEAAETYTAPQYVPVQRTGVVGVNQAKADFIRQAMRERAQATQ